MAAAAAPAPAHGVKEKLARKPAKLGIAIFGVALLIGFVYAAAHLIADLSTVHSTSFIYPFLRLACALLIALGFEFPQF